MVMAKESTVYGSLPGRFVNVAGDDNNDLSQDLRAIVIGAAGAIKITDDIGATGTYTLPAGTYPVRIRRLWLTGTTATGLVGIV